MCCDVVSLADTVPLAPKAAFRLFTERVSDWYRISQHTVPNARATLGLLFEPHVGGRFLAVTDAVTGEGDELGVIEAWNPPAGFAFRDLRGCQVDVRFSAVAAGALVQITVSGLDSLDAQSAATVRRYGWHTVLPWFSSLIEGRASPMSVEFQGVTPNLMYEDAAAAIEWLTRVCGFRERARYVDKEGIVRQAEVLAGEHEIWLSGHGEGFWDQQERGPEVYLVIWVDDVDAQRQRVIGAGVEAPEPTDQSYGVRNFYVTDPGGYHWGFHARLARGYIQEQSLDDGGLEEILNPDL